MVSSLAKGEADLIATSLTLTPVRHLASQLEEQKRIGNDESKERGFLLGARSGPGPRAAHPDGQARQLPQQRAGRVRVIAREGRQVEEEGGAGVERLQPDHLTVGAGHLVNGPHANLFCQRRGLRWTGGRTRAT